MGRVRSPYRWVVVAIREDDTSDTRVFGTYNTEAKAEARRKVLVTHPISSDRAGERGRPYLRADEYLVGVVRLESL